MAKPKEEYKPPPPITFGFLTCDPILLELYIELGPWPCGNCDGERFWLRPTRSKEFVCSRRIPDPNEGKEYYVKH